MLTKPTGSHPVIPSRDELSDLLQTGGTKNKMLSQTQNSSQLLLENTGVEIKQIEIKQGNIIDEIEKLERHPVQTEKQSTHFVITKAVPIDNTPDKA